MLKVKIKQMALRLKIKMICLRKKFLLTSEAMKFFVFFLSVLFFHLAAPILCHQAKADVTEVSIEAKEDCAGQTAENIDAETEEELPLFITAAILTAFFSSASSSPFKSFTLNKLASFSPEILYPPELCSPLA